MEEERYGRDERIRSRNTAKQKQDGGSGFTAATAVQSVLVIVLLCGAFIIKLAGGSFYDQAKQYAQEYLSAGIVFSKEQIAESISGIKAAFQNFYNTYIISYDEPADSGGASDVPADSSPGSQAPSSGEEGTDGTGKSDAPEGQGGEAPVNADLTSGKWQAPANASFGPYLITAVFTKPVEGTVTSPFGYREHPITGKLDFHTGIDIAAPLGTAIFCAMDGKVEEVGWDSTYGNYVIVRHSDTLQTFYGHMESISVEPGYALNRGEVLGTVGTTGISTGPHLHFEIRIDNIRYNPLWIYQGEGLHEFYNTWCKG